MEPVRMGPSRPIAVAIVEDDVPYGEGLATLIAGKPGYRLTGRLSSVEEALGPLATTTPDVLLLHIHLPIPTAGSCTSACVSRLNADDDDYVQWLACTNGSNTPTEYTNPTDLLFSVPDYASVTGGVFELDACASGDDARIGISCLDAAGVGWEIQPVTLFSQTAAVYRYTLVRSSPTRIDWAVQDGSAGAETTYDVVSGRRVLRRHYRSVCGRLPCSGRSSPGQRRSGRSAAWADVLVPRPGPQLLRDRNLWKSEIGQRHSAVPLKGAALPDRRPARKTEEAGEVPAVERSGRHTGTGR